MNIEGVDYSATPPGAAALKAAGKSFALRYLSRDSRGLTRGEYDDLVGNGFDVGLIFESTADRALDDYPAGMFDAEYSQEMINELMLPQKSPVYFTADFDAATWQLVTIDSYLNGAASVIGQPRIGIYGKFSVIEYCWLHGNARYFWQTSAWSGPYLSDHAHLYQYAYNHDINGTECDDVRALTEHWGQVSDYDASTFYPDPNLPDWYQRVEGQENPSQADWDGDRWYPVRANVKAIAGTYPYYEPNTHSPHTGDEITTGTKISVRWMFANEQHKWYANADGYYVASRFTPDLPIPQPRRER